MFLTLICLGNLGSQKLKTRKLTKTEKQSWSFRLTEIEEKKVDKKPKIVIYVDIAMSTY
jgi:hypothetical protein